MRVLSRTLLTLAAAGPVLAQEAASAPAPESERTVVVTADRQPTTVASTTASVSVVDAADRERLGHPALWTDPLRRLPGVDTSSRSGGLDGGGLVDLRLRGTQRRSDTRILLDGIPWHDPSTTEGDPSLGVWQPAGLDRIEVVRGPQSGLHGSHAVGGVVNLISARPTADHHGQARVEAGSFRSRSVDVAASGPLVRGDGDRPTLGYAVGGATFISDGFSLLTPRVTGDPRGVERDGVERRSANARVEAIPVDDLTLYGAGWIAHAEHEYDSTGAEDADAVRLDRQWRAAGGGEWRLPLDATLAGDVAYTTATRDQRDTFNRSRLDSTATYGSARFAMPLAAWLRGQVGVDGQELTADYAAADDRQRSLGGWLQGLASWERWEASGVVRHEQRTGEEARTWRAGAAWLPLADETLKLHATVGTAFRAPSIDEQSSRYFFAGFPPFFPDYLFTGNPDLDPQRSLGWEAGISGEPMERLTLSSTAFGIDYRNRIVRVDAGSDATTTRETLVNESSASRVWGIENGAEWRPRDLPCSAGASYTWQDTRDEDGEAFASTPRSKASLSTTYDLRWGWATAIVDAVSGRRDIDGVRYGGYATLGAVIGWRPAAAVDVYVRGENLLDKAHTEATYFDGSAYSGMPRAVFLGVVGRY